MSPWGEPHTRGAGSTGEIEVAHEALDRMGVVPSGVLAERVLVLVARMTLLAEQSAAYIAAASEVAAHGCDIDRELVQTTIAGAAA